MKKVSQFSFLALLVMATSILAAEQPLTSGYFKWLLHLGQSPTDRILDGSLHGAQLGFVGKDETLRPIPGEVYDFSNTHIRSTTELMIWTPQYSASGSFTHKPLEGQYIHYYHIYVMSPSKRDAHLRFVASEGLRVWNNGQLLFDGWPNVFQEAYIDFVLDEGVNSMTFKVLKYDQNATYLAAGILLK